MPYEYKLVYSTAFEDWELSEDGGGSIQDPIKEIGKWISDEMSKPENQGWEIVSHSITVVQYPSLGVPIATLVLRKGVSV